MARLNPIFVITYRDGYGNTYSEISRDVEKDLKTLKIQQPKASVVCVDRQVGY